jgi:hypothetical protein
LNGLSASIFVERDHLLGETAGRRTEIKPSRRNLGFAGEQLFRGESIEQRLERPTSVDELAPLGVRLSRLVIGDPR